MRGTRGSNALEVARCRESREKWHCESPSFIREECSVFLCRSRPESIMFMPHRTLLLTVALASLGPGCNPTRPPAGEGEACFTATEEQPTPCAPALYCHLTRDPDGQAVLKPNGPGKHTAAGTCREKVAASAVCTKYSTCVDGHSCVFNAPTSDPASEGRCVPRAAGPR